LARSYHYTAKRTLYSLGPGPNARASPHRLESVIVRSVRRFFASLEDCLRWAAATSPEKDNHVSLY